MLFSTTSFATTTEHQEAQRCLYAVPPMERHGFFDSLKTRVEGLQQTANLIEQLIKHWSHLIDELTIDMAKDALEQYNELKATMGIFASLPRLQTSSCDEISASLYTAAHVVKIKVSTQLGVQEGKRSMMQSSHTPPLTEEVAVNNSAAKLTSGSAAAKMQVTFGQYNIENITEYECLVATIIGRSQDNTIYIDFASSIRGQKIQGSFGSIHLAWTDISKTKVACAVKVPVSMRSSENELQREGEIWEYLQTPKPHPNILGYLGTCSIGSNFIGLLSPWVDNAKSWKESLKDHSEGIHIQFIEKIASALQHMHEKGVIHGDIKLSNIIISSNPLIPLLCDFGFSLRWNVDDTRPSLKNRSTAAHMSPEAQEGAKKSLASDVWSFGIMIFHALLKEFPLLNHVQDFLYPEQEYYNLFVGMNLRPQMPSNLTQRGVQSWKVALSCLSSPAHARPCMEEVHLVMQAIIGGREAEVIERLARWEKDLHLVRQ